MEKVKVQRPLRGKLTKTTLSILAFAFAVAGGLVYFGLTKLSSSFISMSADRSAVIKQDLEEFSSSSSERIRARYMAELRQKAENLVLKDASSLVAPFQDNSFAQVKELVHRVFVDDKEIVRANFFVVDESGDVQAWHYVDRNYPQGLDMGLVYNAKSSQWVGTYQGKKVGIADERVKDIRKTDTMVVQAGKFETPDGEVDVYDTYIPVYQKASNLKELAKVVQKGRADKNPIGYLRYTVSLDEMRKAILEEQASLKKYLSKIEDGNKQAAIETQQVGSSLLNQSLSSLGLAVLVIMALAFVMTGFFAKRITSPVLALIEVADKISQGDYKQNISVESDDEIGILASTFKSMSSAIVKRDEELAELNRGLEELVEQRTSQLHTEMKKVKNLLDSMKQGVFTVGADGQVMGPVSQFSETIFKTAIEGKGVYETLFKDVNMSSEQGIMLKTALATVFGEDDMQWMLMEDNLLREVTGTYGDSESILEISYNPLYDTSGNLSQIMFVVDDVTEARKLKAQIELERKQSQERTEILQELARQNMDEIPEFFVNCDELLMKCRTLAATEYALYTNRQEIFRHLHTIKGNSKVFGYNRLGTYIHDAEQYVSNLRDKEQNAISKDDVSNLNSYLLGAERLIEQYRDYAEKMLKIENKSKNKAVLSVHNALLHSQEFHVNELRRYFAEESLDTKAIQSWVASEMLARNLGGGLSQSAVSGNSTWTTLVSLCDREIKGETSPLLLKNTQDFQSCQNIYEDILVIKENLAALIVQDVPQQVAAWSFPTPVVKSLLLKALDGQTDYAAWNMIRSLVAEYSGQSGGVEQWPTVPVYRSLLDRLGALLQNPAVSPALKETFEGLTFVPVKKSVSRYHGLVEETAQKLQKKARFRVSGDDIFLPSKMTDLLTDALTHMIRNSLDHGLESADQRSQAGKPLTGMISLELSDSGAGVEIKVRDDGRGIDPAILREKLVEKKIYTADKVKALSDIEVMNCIFLSEFSTKEAVSDISGRGVGMDAVKKLVEQELDGSLILESAVGVGTTIKIVLPKVGEFGVQQKAKAS